MAKEPAGKAPAARASAGKAVAKAPVRRSGAKAVTATVSPAPPVAPVPAPGATGAGGVDAPADVAPVVPTAMAPRPAWAFVTDPSSLIPTYAGVVAVVAGFALLFYCWSRVAAQADVWRQMPYLVSAGLPGLGLIMAGLVGINISAKRQDGARRAAQMATLTEALAELRTQLDRP